jgi:hypothetical protein
LLLDALLLSASNEASFIEEEEAPTLNTDAPQSWKPEAGMRVEIYWKGIKKWERGTVLRELSKMPGHYRIKYDDGCRDASRRFKPTKWRRVID